MTSVLTQFTSVRESRAVVIASVHVRYPSGLPALRGVSVVVGRGEIVGIVGEPGSGKSAVARLVTGSLVPEEGTVTVLGLSPATDTDELRDRVGVLFEPAGFDVQRTATECVVASAMLAGASMEQARSRCDELFRDLRLVEHSRRLTGELSPGLLRRVELACLLVRDPEVLVLYEATAGLNADERSLVRSAILEQRRQGAGVLWCSIDAAEASEVCDRILVLKGGIVTSRGTAEEIAADSRFSVVEFTLDPDDVEQFLSLVPETVRAVVKDPKVSLHGLAPRKVPAVIQRAVLDGIRIYAVNPRESLQEHEMSMD